MALLQFFSDIGLYPATAEHVAELVQRTPADEVIRVEINSGGGDAFQGENIRAILAGSPHAIEVVIMGMAASAAVTVAMAGDSVAMTENSALMLHQTSAFFGGTAQQIRDQIAVLEAANEGLIKLYVARTGKPEVEVRGWFESTSETWFTPIEAKAAGLVTDILPVLAVAASLGKLTPPDRVRTVLAMSQPVCQSNTMREKLIAKLGLAAEATDEQIESALAAQQDAAVATARAEEQAAAKAVQEAAAAQQIQAEDFPAQVAAAVDLQIKNGKILPAARDAAIKACGTTKIQLNACVNFWNTAVKVAEPVQIVNAPQGGVQNKGTNPFDVDPSDSAAVRAAVKNMSALQQRMCKESGISPEDFVKTRAGQVRFNA